MAFRLKGSSYLWVLDVLEMRAVSWTLCEIYQNSSGISTNDPHVNPPLLCSFVLTGVLYRL